MAFSKASIASSYLLSLARQKPLINNPAASRRVIYYFTPKSGDGIFLPAGTVHAMGGDVVIFEVQQNSDVTFRLYDWDHIDAKTGQSRALQVDQAVKELQKSGYDMKKLSIMGKDYHSVEDVLGYYNTGDRMKKWGKMGTFWGAFWGILFGSAFFIIPGIGPIVSVIVGGLEGTIAVGGLSALGAGLYSIGIPKDSVIKYETAIKSDKYLVIAHGTADEVAKAKEILAPLEKVEIAVHHA